MIKKVPIEALNQNGTVKYSERLKQESQSHRRTATESEKIFWYQVLKNDKTGYRFTRQKPIGRFILDFYCSELLLAIEIDGNSHDQKQAYDNERDKYLLNRNIKTIRYSNDQVISKINIVISNLKERIKLRKQELSSVPSCQRGN